jgi:hypothetical protein
VIAKGNASEAFSPEFSGTYVLTPVAQEAIAKRNAWTVKITALSRDLPVVRKNRSGASSYERVFMMQSAEN